jgi:hypothetical protein
MQCAIASGRAFVHTVNEIVGMALGRAGRVRRNAGDQLLAEYYLSRKPEG